MKQSQALMYNIPIFNIGGILAKIAKSAKNIQGQANLVGKTKNPELFNLLSKLAKSQKGGTKLTEEESRKLVTLVQNYRRKNVHYQARRKKFNEALSERAAAERAATEAAEKAAAEKAATEAAEKAAAEKAAAEAAEKAAAEAAATGVVGKTKHAVTAATSAAQGRLAKAWGVVKRHPWITGGTLLGLSNGTVRQGIGTGLSYWTTPVSQWDQIGTQSPTGSQMQIRLNDGSIVPITMGDDGILTFGSTTETEGSDPTADAIAQAIAEANGTASTGAASTGAATTQAPSLGSFATNEELNDVFEDDAWDQ